MNCSHNHTNSNDILSNEHTPACVKHFHLQAYAAHDDLQVLMAESKQIFTGLREILEEIASVQENESGLSQEEQHRKLLKVSLVMKTLLKQQRDQCEEDAEMKATGADFLAQTAAALLGL